MTDDPHSMLHVSSIVSYSDCGARYNWLHLLPYSKQRQAQRAAYRVVVLCVVLYCVSL